MNNHVHSALSGTNTHKNLTDAFGGEARSAMRYRLFSKAAADRGDAALAKLLGEIAENEAQHAELWMQYLGEMGDNAANLESALASEEYETEVMYPEFAATAKNEGFSEIADKFGFAADAEGNHAKMLSEYLEKLRNGTLYSSDTPVGWLCTNCGYIHNGTEAPERCPLCSYPVGYFTREES